MDNKTTATRLTSMLRVPIVAVMVALTGLIGEAGAANFVVTSTANTTDISPGDGICDDGSGSCTLRAAIVEANSLPGADTIDLAVGGTYILVTPDTSYGACNFGTFSGLPAINSTITINGNGARILRSSSISTPPFNFFCVHSAGDLTLKGVTLSGGSTPAGGGALYNNGVTTIIGSTISGNYGGNGANAPGGGGILNWSGTLTLGNSTVSGNTSYSGYGGGGILNFSGGTIAVISSTIAENKADGPPGFQGRGDAVADAFSPVGSVTIKNSIMASPSTGLGSDCFAFAPASLGHNIASDSSCGLNGTGDLPNVNPMLGPLANNGGHTMTHALLAGSPALDAIPVANCTDLNGAPLATDQRGVVRAQGAACDIGAFELQAQALLTVAGTGPFQNQLMVVNPLTCSASAVGVTQDTSSGPVRRIRGLAYGPSGVLYGVTREGDVVQVDRFTGTTVLLGTVSTNSTAEFWSGLALDPTGTYLYAVNAFGTQNLVRYTLPAGPAVQVGSTRAFNFNFQVLGLAFEPGVTPTTMYGANRNNDNIVEVDPLTGALSFTWGSAVVPGSNRQQIAVNPTTNEIWGIHDDSPLSNNAALYKVGSPFPTGNYAPICNLPFGIIETVGGGNDTYGWGGLAFVPDDYGLTTNSLTVIKILVPASDSGRFRLTVDGSAAGSGANVGNGGTTGTISVISGAHIVAESGIAGTDLGNYVSVIDGDCAADGSVTFVPGVGANKTCTITNSRRPTLTLRKSLFPSKDQGVFNLTIDGATAGTGADVGDGGTTGAVTVGSGAHIVGETAGKGTNLKKYTTIIGGDCAANGSITLAPGDNKTCTIVNTKSATLTVTKILIPGNDPGKFDLTIDGVSPTKVGTNVSNGGTTGIVPVGAGLHQVGEMATPGTTLAHYTAVYGGDCDAKGRITLAKADEKTCTITNTRATTLAVVKQIAPNTDPGRFNLTIDGATAGTGANVGHGGSTGIVPVGIGTHTVGETAGTATTLANYKTTFSGACATNGSVTLAVGENKTCTITNTAFWTTKASMPQPRSDFGVGVVNGILYVLGGLGGPGGWGVAGPIIGAVDAYDPITNTWTSKANMPTKRRDFGVAVVNGIIYVMGGTTPSGGSLTMDAYDPATNSWSTKAAMPLRLVEFGVGVTGGKLYALGGVQNSLQPPGVVAAYDPVSNTWTTKAPMLNPRLDLGVEALGGSIYAVGGQNNGTGPGVATVDAYDPVANSWASKAPLLTPRDGLRLGVINATLYAIGGDDGIYNPVYKVFGDMQSYDPVSNAWKVEVPMPTPRTEFGVGVINGVLYAVGGRIINNKHTAILEAYTP
jgi:CSLREA domain-containing protein